MNRFRLVNILSAVLLVSLMALAGTLVNAAPPRQGAIDTATATPLALPTLVPSVTTPDESALQRLGEAVETANRLAGASTAWRDHQPADVALQISIGDKLPGFGLMTHDGAAFRSDVAGEPLLLNFWASWCPPCVEEFPLLIAANNDPVQPYRVVFINIWDDKYTYEEFLGDYPDVELAMRDSSDVIASLYGLDFVPVSIFVDETGDVVLIQYGLVHEAVLELAAALLAVG